MSALPPFFKESEAGIDTWPLNPRPDAAIHDAVQGDLLTPSGLGPAPVSALGFRDDRWLIVGHGPGSELARIMRDHGVRDALWFAAPGDSGDQLHHGMHP